MFETIVVGTDGSDTASEAVRVAVELARLSRARLHIVRAFRPASVAVGTGLVPEFLVGVEEAENACAQEVDDALEALAHDIRAAGVEVQTHGRPQGAAEAIIDVALATGADLVVVGNRGMQGTRRLLGSVPNSVTHHAPCGVLIVNSAPGRGALHTVPAAVVAEGRP